MIVWTDTLMHFINTLDKLDIWVDLGSTPVDQLEEYIFKHGPRGGWYEEEDRSEYELTDEELDIMEQWYPGYENWYGKKVIDDILLGENDER